MSKEDLIKAHIEAHWNKTNGKKLSIDLLLETFKKGMEAGMEIANQFDSFEAWKAGETFGANYISPFSPKDELGSRKAYEAWKSSILSDSR